MKLLAPNNIFRWSLIFPLIIALVHGVYAYFFVGPIMSPDSRTYHDYANQIILSNFNIFAIFERQERSAIFILYIGYPYIVAICKALFDESWLKALLGFNVLLNVFFGCLLYRLIRLSTKSHLASLIMMLIFLLSFEWFQWMPYILTDFSFSVLGFSIFYMLYKSGLSQKGTRAGLKIWIIILVLCLAALFYRPVAIPLFAITVLVVILTRIHCVKSRIQILKRVTFLLGICIILATIVQTAVVKQLVQDDVSLPSMGQVITQFYRDGVVISDRPLTYHAPPESYVDYLLISLDRLVRFFDFTAATYSFKHQLFNALFFVPLYFFALMTVYRLFQNETPWTAEKLWLGWLSLYFITFFAVFHSLTQLDYDWRYRLPCFPQIMILACLGAEDVLANFKERVFYRFQKLRY
jgi:hypothetical protein